MAFNPRYTEEEDSLIAQALQDYPNAVKAMEAIKPDLPHRTHSSLMSRARTLIGIRNGVGAYYDRASALYARENLVEHWENKKVDRSLPLPIARPLWFDEGDNFKKRLTAGK